MINHTFAYGSFTVDGPRVPEASVRALMQRGIAHLLGNEQAAKVTSWKQKSAIEAATKAGETGADKLEGTALAALVEKYGPADESIAAYREGLINEAILDIYNGEIGSGRGPAMDPVDREFESLVKAEIANKLAGAGFKFAKGRKLPTEDEVVKFANGETRTLAEMIENTKTKHGERLRKEASKRVEALAKKAAEAKAKAKALADVGPVEAGALDL